MVDPEPSKTAWWLTTYIIEGAKSLAIIDPGPKASLKSFKELIRRLRVDSFKEV